MDGVSIRLLPNAIDAVAAVMTVMETAFPAEYGEAWTRAQLTGMLALPQVDCWLAGSEAAPAGFALVRRVLDEAELLLLAVDPARRREGTGSALLDAVILSLKNRQLSALFLEMREGNDAVHLYRRFGFHMTGRRPSYYRTTNGGTIDALTYCLQLNRL